MLNKQMQNKKEEKEQDNRRKERQRQEEREDRKQENQNMIETTAVKEGAVVKPKKNIKYHKPVDTYEFEYDETEDDLGENQ